MIERYHLQKKVWTELYHDMYIIGTECANVKIKTHDQDAQHTNPTVDDQEPEVMPLFDGLALQRIHGYQVVSRATWGATYSSFLFSFLQSLDWKAAEDDNPRAHIQWVE